MTLYFWSNIAHLDDDEGVLTRGTRGKENIGIEFTRRALDTVTKVLDEGWGSCPVEATMEEKI